MTDGSPSTLKASAGLMAGPLGWALAQQAGSSLVLWRCAAAHPAMPATVTAGLLLALAGGWLSWRSWRGGTAGAGRFLALLSVMAAGLFAATLLLQILASLFYGGCER